LAVKPPPIGNGALIFASISVSVLPAYPVLRANPAMVAPLRLCRLRAAFHQYRARRRVGLLLLLVLVVASAHAQYSLDLLVLDSASAEPLVGVSAVVMGTSMSATSDAQGRAHFPALSDGPHQLRMVSMGYRPLELFVTMAGRPVTITVRLAPEAEELEVVEVTVTRTNSRIEDVPQKIEVLGAEELQEESTLKPGNIASLIGDISSVQVQQTSGVSGSSAVRLQGLDGRHTLLLRDGMPAFGGLSGGFDLLRIPPLDLERVELVKGPSSTFNGGGAIAGAINFVSRSPADSLCGVALINRASLGETNANVYISGPVGGSGFTLFGGSTMQNAVDVDGNGYSDLADARTYLVHPQVFLRTGGNGRLRLGGGYQVDRRTGGDMGALDAPPDTMLYFQRVHGERTSADVQYERTLGDRIRLMVKGAWSGNALRLRDNFSAEQRAQQNVYAEAYLSRSLRTGTWVVGGNLVGSRLSGTVLPPQRLLTNGLFTQLALRRGRWKEVDIGLRLDAPQGQALQVLPAVSGLYQAGSSLMLRANLGTGYQLPDRSRNYGTVSEEALAKGVVAGTIPERSWGGTLEWTIRKVIGAHTSVFVDQTFFATGIVDPLMLGSDGEGGAMLRNADATMLTRGVDNYVRLTHGGTEVYLGYTYTLPELRRDGRAERITYTAMHRSAGTLSHAFGAHWRAGLEAAWTGQQIRNDGRSTRAQWFLAAMVGWSTGSWNVVLNGENMADARQTRWESIVSGSPARPVFAPLWAPIDGRVVNLSVLHRFAFRKHHVA